MRTLICGSLAFDSIMVFQDHFKHHILPDKIHMLNVSFLVPEMRREYGGCAGNIAYNLKLLGGEPLIMATVGDDFAAYAERLDALAIPRDYIHHVAGTYTAQAFITTDLDDNQITAFHPGAMNYSHENDVRQVLDLKLGIVAPDGRDGMLRHVRGFHEAGVPCVFDPGQGMPLFSGEELLECVHKSSYVILNDYEAELLQSRTGENLATLARHVEALIVTRGGEGSVIHTAGGQIDIPAVRPAAILDPTGCGDAYRSGILYGITHGLDWETAGQLASVMGAIKIEHRGGQNHAPSRQEIAGRLKITFGKTL
ncbi:MULTISPECIES: carbohydrate kinase family protein [unclassified Thiobacillus]|uniref:carbohydrate kinase family protein n=1 Tax=unclassified Thiobacillus TaxID=2646513 RepID=UPI00086898F6|nr:MULTISPECIES: carbohydrate kinase family protein [unclassified Thiobacillus]MBN8779328.1 carbohydrate kinase family protein [Thiobacillus sp.]ODV00638.1 MAG: sugar kinase [Thiobacillus sp. SCN 63-57]